MKLLLTSDPHFTDNPRDRYRFGLFPWLVQQQRSYKVDATFILGDLTDQKDKHSSTLVNSIVSGLQQLKPPVFIVKGNHDYLNNENNPFFRFLSAIPGVKFYIYPEYIEDLNAYIIPHQTNQADLDTAFKTAPEGCLIMCHQTFTGAQSDVGGALTGFTLPPNKAKAIYSGDIHVPQVLNSHNGNIIYVGSPYHTRMGREYKCRALLLDGKRMVDLHFDAPRKLSLTVRDVSELSGLKKGDQVKVTLELARSEMVEWANHKQAILQHCKDQGIEVFGTELKVPPPVKRATLDETISIKKSNMDYFQAFCSKEQVPIQIKKAGIKLVSPNGT